MYGLIGRLQATPGAGNELAEILASSVEGMPGCMSYIVAIDSEDEDSIWVTEVWDSEESHQASLQLPQVQQAIQRGRPLIAGMHDRRVTRPIGGHGL